MVDLRLGIVFLVFFVRLIQTIGYLDLHVVDVRVQFGVQLLGSGWGLALPSGAGCRRFASGRTFEATTTRSATSLTT